MRVTKRVAQGGHNILAETIERRYFRGIANLMKLYIPICDKWVVANNAHPSTILIAKGYFEQKFIYSNDTWQVILQHSLIDG